MKNQLFLVGAVIFFCFSCEMKVDKSPVFEISFSEALSSGSFDGRLLLLISTNDENEPRFQISDGTTTQQVYGVDVAGMKPGEPVRMDKLAFGYPVRSLSELEPGEYYVQAFLHKYDTYTLANGHTVSLPASWAAGSRWNREPGNYYSTPVKVTIGSGSNIKIVMDQEIPPVTQPEDTRYIKAYQNAE